MIVADRFHAPATSWNRFMTRPIRRHGAHSFSRPHRPPVLPQVELQITRGRARNSVRSITGLAFLIGAADDNDLVLADEQFPDSHSYLLRSPLGLMLCWLGEGPEITVDAEPVLSSAAVPDGARLRTGPYEFRLRVSWPQASQSSELSEEDFPRSLTLPEVVLAEDPALFSGLSFPSPQIDVWND